MVSINLIKQLEERGIIEQVTNKKLLAERLSTVSITLYCGFDPTADSLHLGHLMPLLCLKRFQMAGHRPIALIGGATGLIGDPSFKARERKLNSKITTQKWVEKIKHQVLQFLDFNCGSNSAIIVNNCDWFNSMNILVFLRNVGKYFSVNQMINKEAVKQRLKREDSGISFTEFSYNLLQSYDYAYLNKQYNVVLQIGGSDQWGNITSGIHLTRYLNHQYVDGLTVPLITKADGNKFGKNENDTIWLDSTKTSPYKFYQFWINISDDDVYRFLKFFTFLELSRINQLEKEGSIIYQVPRTQYILAQEMTRMVHGEQGLAAAKRITTNLFSNTFINLTEDDFIQLKLDGMPTISLERGTDLQQALVVAKLVSSRGQAKILISSNAVTINGKKQVLVDYIFKDTDTLYGQYTLLRRGKKHHCLINWK